MWDPAIAMTQGKWSSHTLSYSTPVVSSLDAVELTRSLELASPTNESTKAITRMEHHMEHEMNRHRAGTEQSYSSSESSNVTQVRIWIGEETDSPPLQPVTANPSNLHSLAIATHDPSTAPWIRGAPFMAGLDDISIQPYTSVPTNFLSGLPADCLYNILLHLDGASIGACGTVSREISSLVAGEDASSAWTSAARNDPARLRLEERLMFRSYEQQPQASTHRTLYLLRLKQRAQSRAGMKEEELRIRQVRVEAQLDRRRRVRTELVLETIFMLTIPFSCLISAILLLISASLPNSSAWCIFVPIWTAIILTCILLRCMNSLRAFDQALATRKTKDFASAILQTPSSARSTFGSMQLPASPTASSNGSAVATAPTAAAKQKQRRDESNARFLDQARALQQPVRDGWLQSLLDAYCSQNRPPMCLAKVGLVLAASILLCIKLSAVDSDMSRLTYAEIGIPLFLLSLWRFFDVIFDSTPLAPPRLERVKSWLLWFGPLMAFMVLLVMHLDGVAISLAEAFIPLWIWQGVLLIGLAWLCLQFGCGIRVLVSNESNKNATSRWSVSLDPNLRNIRLGCTMFVAFLALAGVVIFEVFLCLRSVDLNSRWTMEIVAAPLVASLALCTILSAASALQMVRQKRAAVEAEPSTPSG